MKDLMPSLGSKLREIRKSKKLTMDQLTLSTGLSKGLLSKIENNATTPSISTMRKLSLALGVPLVDFFDQSSSADSFLLKKGQQKKIYIPNTNIVYTLLSPNSENKKIEFILTEMEPQTIDETPHIHPGEEYGFLIKGKLKVFIDGQIYTLEEGDSINFPGSVSHYVSNPFDTESVSVWAIIPPMY